MGGLICVGKKWTPTQLLEPIPNAPIFVVPEESSPNIVVFYDTTSMKADFHVIIDDQDIRTISYYYIMFTDEPALVRSEYLIDSPTDILHRIFMPHPQDKAWSAWKHKEGRPFFHICPLNTLSPREFNYGKKKIISDYPIYSGDLTKAKKWLLQ